MHLHFHAIEVGFGFKNVSVTCTCIKRGSVNLGIIQGQSDPLTSDLTRPNSGVIYITGMENKVNAAFLTQYV